MAEDRSERDSQCANGPKEKEYIDEVSFSVDSLKGGGGVHIISKYRQTKPQQDLTCSYACALFVVVVVVVVVAVVKKAIVLIILVMAYCSLI